LTRHEFGPKLDAITVLRRVFSEDFYLLAYPDVAKSGFDAWDHFLEYGLREGRSPNPYVDPEYMSNLLGLPISNTLLQAFSEKRYWITNTSPYVDIQNFIMTGMWNGEDHPLQQLIEEGNLGVPWLKLGNSFGDLSPLGDEMARLKAMTILLHLNGKALKSSKIKEVAARELGQSELSIGKKLRVTCVPGQFISVGDVGYFLSDHKTVIGEDNSVIYYGNRFAFFEKGDEFESKLLVLAPKAANRQEARKWLLTLGEDTTIAPSTADQEQLLKFLAQENNLFSLNILEFGIQAHISCERVIVSRFFGDSNRRVPGKLDYLRRKSILIVSENFEDLIAHESTVKELISRGASICVSDNRSAKLWIKKMRKTKLVVTCGQVSWVDIWFSKSIPIIDSREWMSNASS
jgi:hypothetical protein